MHKLMLLLCSAAFACGGAGSEAGDEQDVTVPRHLFTLANAPVAGAHPAALVHLGKGFRADGPLNLVVHFHGWQNCIENVGEARSSPCTRGAPARTAQNLIGQLDQSGVNAALVLVEIHYDQATSDDGKLAQPGFFRSMILELLPDIGSLAGRNYDESQLGALVLTSHSGGYQALAHVLDRGGLTDHVRQVILLDSVYGNIAQFEAWAQSAPGARIAVIYTSSGGTLVNSQRMASDQRSWLTQAGLDSKRLLDDRTTATLPDGAFDASFVFKHSGLSHDGTAQYYFGKLLAHAGLQ
jgi:hypothetical protein